MEKENSSYNNNKFKISAPTWNDKLRLPDGSCSVSDIQDYVDYILKTHGEKIDNPSIHLRSNENKITEDKNGENVPHFHITEIVLVHCNIVNNDY